MHAVAQSIQFMPAAPKSGETVRVLFSEPFACDAAVPALRLRVAVESVFPGGIVNCPMIPYPPPQASNFSVEIGGLLPGVYAVSWKIHTSDAPGTRRFVASSSASFAVRAADAAAPRPGRRCPLPHC